MSDKQKNIWEKVSRAIGLYRYVPNGRYFARVRYWGKLYRKSLETDDSALAKAGLQSFGAPLNAQTQQAAEKVLLPFWTNIAQR
jgi:hypothetical protein